MTSKYISADASFSADGLYRYSLYRAWDMNGKIMLVIGLNPSTATAVEDDPTIRRCIGFAKREGCGEFYMGNVFGLRSTDPKKLLEVDDPIGQYNNFWLKTMAREAEVVIAAWGGNPLAVQRGREIRELLQWIPRKIHCLGKTKSGAPKHPLYLRKDTPLEIW